MQQKKNLLSFIVVGTSSLKLICFFLSKLGQFLSRLRRGFVGNLNRDIIVILLMLSVTEIQNTNYEEF